MLNGFLLSFIPLFVAIDAIGILPMFVGFTEHLKGRDKRRILNQSVITAFAAGIGFLFLGRWIFSLLGILVADFKIAGGLVLLVISLRDLLQYEKAQRLPVETMGAVPIGTPLITGPAVLTTMVILQDTHGLFATVLSFMVNLLIVWLVFFYSEAISSFLGKAGSKAVSKIAHLLLAAIAVMMIRKGALDTAAYFLSQRQ